MLSTPQSVQAWTCYPPQLLTDSSNWAIFAADRPIDLNALVASSRVVCGGPVAERAGV
jgi:hypothetical protein